MKRKGKQLKIEEPILSNFMHKPEVRIKFYKGVYEDIEKWIEKGYKGNVSVN